ncbi:hypothetical protein DPMN_031980 [Dreissena polymorpha]|uniref:Uncharacterized protein n=1 Tax=Dreissena polymorpha TaxID=45954 RepID=A0A9D4M5N4_DREPO|nr:hypothetical protein DPMN_031980 [Dreissena polymorpha]
MPRLIAGRTWRATTVRAGASQVRWLTFTRCLPKGEGRCLTPSCRGALTPRVLPATAQGRFHVAHRK